MSVEIVDWRITASCNNECGFCYAASNLESVSSAQAIEVISSIYEMHCDTVCITGGEPLLKPEFAIGIMERLKGLGITIYLSTNGTNYIDNVNTIEPLISKLSIPLDGFGEKSNQINGRNSKSFGVTKGILDLYKRKKHAFPIKVATVLTKKSYNIDHFVGIYNLLKNYSIDLWKIYQFIPESRGQLNQHEYCITENEWNDFISELQPMLDKDAGNRQFSIAFTSRKERDSTYFIVQPDATVIIPIDNLNLSCDDVVIDNLDLSCNDVVIGNLITENTEYVIEKWKKLANRMNVIRSTENRNVIRPINRLHIDEIDKKLLSVFDSNPLLSDLEFSERMKIPEDDVNIRLKKLFQIRAIKKVIPILNVSNFGFEIYLLNLFFASRERASYIADVLCHHANIGWVAECYDWDELTHQKAIFRVAIFAENTNRLYTVLSELENIFGSSLLKYEIDIVPDKYVCGQRFMLKELPKVGIDASHICLDHQGKNTVSKLELNLLLALRAVERPTISSLAQYMKSGKKQIEILLDKFRKDLVINKYQAVFDTNVLGYKCYILFVKFSSIGEKKSFEDYVKIKKEVSHINTLSNGLWDIDVEIKVEHPEQCFNLIGDFEVKFKGQIQRSKIIRVENEHKFEFLIPVVLDVAENNSRNSIFKKF